MGKTLSETLADNLGYYINNGNVRCVLDGKCRYSSKCRYSGKSLGIESEGCFVGRLMDPEQAFKADDILSSDESTAYSGGISDLLNIASLGKIKLPSFIVKNSELIKGFQNLHDENHYWVKTPKGLKLSESGSESLEMLINNSSELEIKDFKKYLI